MDSGNEERICQYVRLEQAKDKTHAGRIRLTQATVRRQTQQRRRPQTDSEIASATGAEGRGGETCLGGVEVLQVRVDQSRAELQQDVQCQSQYWYFGLDTGQNSKFLFI